MVVKSLEDPELSRSALNTLHLVFQNAKLSESKEVLKQVDACFEQAKGVLLSKVLPTGDS